MSILAALPQGPILGELTTPSNNLDTADLLTRIRNSFHGGQIDFLDDTITREIGIAAGYGSGKTLGLCGKAVQLAILNPGYVGCVLEPTGPMLRDIWIRKFDDFLDRFEIPYTFRASPLPEHVLHLPEGDTPVIARSLENFRRIVGPDWAWALADEIDTVQASIAQRAYEKIVGRIRVGRVNQLGFVSTPEGFGWHYKTFGAPGALDGLSRRLIRMRSQDNPHLPASYLDSLRERYTGPMLQAYMEGIYVNLTSGQVYDRFSRDHHVRPLADPLAPGEPLMVGVDFNVGNMHAVIMVARGRDLHAVGEVVGAHDTDDLARRLTDRYAGHPLLGYPDASGANRSTNSSLSDIGILEQWGIVNRAPRANPLVRDRVQVVQTLLLNAKGETRLWISPDCAHTIECLERQAYNDKGEPDKENGYDHACFAAGTRVRTPLAPILGEPIENLAMPGFCIGPFGTPVRRGGAVQTGERHTVLLRFGSGHAVECTPEHRWLTEGGQWVEAQNLRPGDKIASQLSSAQPVRILLARLITYVATTFSAMAGVFIGWYGRQQTARSLTAAMYITLTAIDQTITQITSRCFWLLNTLHFTGENKAKPQRNVGTLGLASVCLRLLQSGTVAKKAASGIMSTTKGTKISYMPNDTSENALSAGPSTTRQYHDRSAAQINAKRSTGAVVESMMKTGCAVSAVQHSALTSTNASETVHERAEQRQHGQNAAPLVVESVTATGKTAPVYCFTTGIGTFALANGALVSNCDALGYVCHTLFAAELGFGTQRPTRVGEATYSRAKPGHKPIRDKAERILSRAGW